MQEGQNLEINGINYQVRKIICGTAILLNLNSVKLKLERIKVFKA